MKESDGDELPKVLWPCWTEQEVQDKKAMHRTLGLCLDTQLLQAGSLLGTSLPPCSPH